MDRAARQPGACAAELLEAGEPDAGAFLVNLQELDAAKFQAFLKDPSNHGEWGDEVKGEPVEKRVEGLIALLVRLIGGGGGTQLSPVQMQKWIKAATMQV